MADIIQNRRDTAEQWELINPVLAQGEIGIELYGEGNDKFKIGDAITPWNDLAYAQLDQIQSDWNQLDNTKSDYIKNKPSLSGYDSHITDSTIHYPQLGISITESQISDLKSYIVTETDPVFNAHIASSITITDIINWNNKQTALGFIPENILNKENVLIDNNSTKYPTVNLLKVGLDSKENSILSGSDLQYYRGDKSWATLNTTVVPEGTNLYFTDQRARDAIANNDLYVQKSGDSITGKLGIGRVQSTTDDLDVNGTSKFRGNIIADNNISASTIKITQGAANNYMLVSDAEGNASWVARSASEVYKGTWDASTNTPTLANGTGTVGNYYRVVVAGTVNLGSGNITFEVGDDVRHDGSIWQRVPGAGFVLQTATSTVLGGVKIGAGMQIDNELINVKNENKGDITVSGTNGSIGRVWTINNSAVTFAKIQNITGPAVIGRQATSTGITSELNMATLREMLNVADGANYYIHPEFHSATMITTDENNNFVSNIQITNWNTAYNRGDHATAGYIVANQAITGDTKTKITYDLNGLVTAGTDLVAADIPNLATSKITSGSFTVARGGTGRSTLTLDTFLVGNGTAAIKMLTSADVRTAITDINNMFVSEQEKNTWNTKQNDLGVPTVDGYLLSSLINGTRSWIAPYTHPTLAAINITATESSVISTVSIDTLGHVTAFTTRSLSPGNIGAVVANLAITASTKCKITYDSKGLVTTGADLAVTDIPTLTSAKISDFVVNVRTSIDASSPILYNNTTGIISHDNNAGNKHIPTGGSVNQLLQYSASGTASWWTPNYLTTNQSISLSGDISGSGNTSITTTLATISGLTAGTYNNSATSVRPFTIDIKGRITGIGTAITITPDWTSITNRPPTFTPSAHVHSANDITSGTIQAGARLGTGTNGFLKYDIGIPIWSVITKTDVGLSNVENTALSTWTGSGNITTIGTLESGTVPWARLSDVPSYSLSTHVHGNITNDGKIGSTANLVLQTGTGGLITAKTAGTSSQFLNGAGAWATPPNTIYTHPNHGGEVSSTIGDGALTLVNSAVIGKVLTGYISGTNTALAATDTILQAFEKTQGQINAKQNTLTTGLVSSGNTAITVTGSRYIIGGTMAITHATTDGNLHVPATSTTNNARFLKAGSTAGSLSWSLLADADIPNSAVIGKVLTGYNVGSNVALAAADTILQAFQKVQGQLNSRLTENQTITLSGIVTGSGKTTITTAIADGALSIAKTSGLQSALNELQFLQSGRDFPNGTLITTNIDYSVTNGNPFLLEIEGNSYSGGLPIDIKIQGYIYNNTIINRSYISNGYPIAGVVAFNQDGNLCFWFPYQAYWQGFNVFINSSHVGVKKNRLVSITHAIKPVDITKEVTFTPVQSWHDGNLINPVTGTGTVDRVARFTGTSAIGSSSIRDNGTSAAIGVDPVTGASMFLSGTNYSSLAFQHSSQSRYWIYQNASDIFHIGARGSTAGDGAIRIGNAITGINTAPVSGVALSIAGQTKATITSAGAPTVPMMFINSSTTDGAEVRTFYSTTVDGGRSAYIGAVNVGGTAAGSPHHLIFATNVGGAAPVERMRLSATGLGILTAPASGVALTVGGATSDLSKRLLLVNNANYALGRGSGVGFGVPLSSGGAYFEGGFIGATCGGGSGVGHGTLVFRTAKNQVLSDRMFINEDGLVGILTAPASGVALTVGGNQGFTTGKGFLGNSILAGASGGTLDTVGDNTTRLITPFSSGFNALNDPNGASYWTGFEMRHNLAEDYRSQIATGSTATTPILAIRNKTNGTWGSWASVWTDANFTQTDINSWNARVSGTGNTNYVAKFTAAGTIGSSVIQDNGTVGIGTAPVAGNTATFAAAASVSLVTDLGYKGALRINEPAIMTAGQFYPMLVGNSRTTSGYRDHYVIGGHRPIASAWGRMFFAIGGNDNHPTSYYYMQSVTSGLGHSSGVLNLDGIVGVGTSAASGFALTVGGKARITTVENGAGDFLTRNASGDVTRRIASEVLADITAGGTINRVYRRTNGGLVATGTIRETDAGLVGIGGDSLSYTPLAVRGVPSTILGTIRATSVFVDTNPLALGNGGGIAFGGVYTTAGDLAPYAGISGYKTNATSNNGETQLHFQVRQNGELPTTRMKLAHFGLGVNTDPVSGVALTVGGKGRVQNSTFDVLDVYRITSSANAGAGLSFSTKNSADAITAAAYCYGGLATTTAGAENGFFFVDVKNAGADLRAIIVRPDGIGLFTDRVSGVALTVGGKLQVNTIDVRAIAATVFLTHNGGLLQTRTADQVRGDISAASSTHNHDLVYAPIAHVSDSVIHVTAGDKTNWNGKENAFSKNSAFNKNFGTGNSDVPRGDAVIYRLGQSITDADTIGPDTVRTVTPFSSSFQSLNLPTTANYWSGFEFRHNLASDYRSQWASGTNGTIPVFLIRNKSVSWGLWYSVYHTGNFTKATIEDLLDGNITSHTHDYSVSTHVHGNISNTGTINSTANLPLITGTSGIITTGSFGTTVNTFCQGNDSRLSNARTPTNHDLINATHHPVSGLTTGHYIRATDATAYNFSAIQAGDVPVLNQNTTGSSGSCTGESYRAKGLSRSDVASDSYNVQSRWNGTHWVLAGYNGVSTFHAGCRVTYSETAGSTSQLLTAGNGITGDTFNGGTARTWNIVSQAGTAGSIGTINVTTTAIGVSLGTTATTACAGNDSRLHTHDNINFLNTINQSMSTSDSPTFLAFTVQSTLNTNALRVTTSLNLNPSSPTVFSNGDLWISSTNHTLNGTINGNNVQFYHTNYKPSAADVGAAPSVHNHDTAYLGHAAGGVIDVNALNGTKLFTGSTNSWTNKGPSGNNAGALLSLNTHSGSYYSQLWFDTALENIYYRGNNAATGNIVATWKKIWHEGNFNPSDYFRSTAANEVDVRLVAGHGRGLRFWDSDSYKIYMSASTGYANYGGRRDSTSDYNMYFRMTGGTNRGWVFQSTTTNAVAQIDAAGNGYFAGKLFTSGGHIGPDSAIAYATHVWSNLIGPGSTYNIQYGKSSSSNVVLDFYTRYGIGGSTEELTMRLSGGVITALGNLNTSGNLNVNNNLKVGSSSNISIVEIREMTGSCPNSGQVYEFNLPSGYTADNTRVLSFDLNAGQGIYIVLRQRTTTSFNVELVSDTISKLRVTQNVSASAFRALIARVA